MLTHGGCFTCKRLQAGNSDAGKWRAIPSVPEEALIIPDMFPLPHLSYFNHVQLQLKNSRRGCLCCTSTRHVAWVLGGPWWSLVFGGIFSPAGRSGAWQWPRLEIVHQVADVAGAILRGGVAWCFTITDSMIFHGNSV